MKRVSSWFVSAALLAGCSGGGRATSPIPSASSVPAAQNGNARLAIAVPSKEATHALRRDYVSPNTNSLTVVSGSFTATVTLNVSNPECVVQSTGFLCTVPVALPIGTDTLVVTTYASSNGSGPALSTATMTTTITPGTTNLIQLTLNGIPVSAGIQPALGTAAAGGQQLATTNPYVEATNFPATSITLVGGQVFNLTLFGIDASGATIVGAGAPTLTLLPSKACGRNAPVPGVGVFPPYDFSLQVTAPFAPCAYDVFATNAQGSATGTPINTIEIGALSAVYVSSGSTVYIFDANGEPIETNGSVSTFSPVTTSFQGPQQLAYDPAPFASNSIGIIYVADPPGNQVVGFADSGAQIGAAASLSSPYGLAYDATAMNLYSSDSSGATGISQISTAPSLEFTASYNNVATGTPPAGLFGLTQSPSLIYAADQPDNALYTFNPRFPMKGLTQLVQGNGLNGPIGVAYDLVNGNLYVANSGNATITEYSKTGAQIPTTGFAGLGAPSGIAYDKLSGNLIVSDSAPKKAASPRIVEYTPAGAVVPYPSPLPSASPDGFAALTTTANNVSVSP